MDHIDHWVNQENFVSITRANHCLSFPSISLQAASGWILGDLWLEIGAYVPNLWKCMCNSKMLGKIWNHLC